MNKVKAVWFSRHLPTAAQADELDLVMVEEGMVLGARSISTPEEAAAMARTLRALAKANGAKSVAGVFPTALLAEAWRNAVWAVNRGDFGPGAVGLLAAVNDSRSPEGGKPTFTHLRWEEVGVI